jgi:hypothetical protein
LAASVIINLSSFFVRDTESFTLAWPGGPVRRFDTELLGVLRVQPLPTGELRGVTTSDAADGSSAEKAIQNIERNVPSGSAH